MRKVLSILGQLSDEDVEWIARQGHKMECAVGQTLISAGQPVTRLFILLDGEVAILLPNGAELVRVGSGEILGEMSLVDKSPPSASARITEKSTFLAIDQDLMRQKMELFPLLPREKREVSAAERPGSNRWSPPRPGRSRPSPPDRVHSRGH